MLTRLFLLQPIHTAPSLSNWCISKFARFCCETSNLQQFYPQTRLDLSEIRLRSLELFLIFWINRGLNFWWPQTCEIWGVWVLCVRWSWQGVMEQFLVTLGFTLTCRLVKSILCQESSGSGWVGDSPQTNPNSGCSDFRWISLCNLSLQIPLWHCLTFCWILPFSDPGFQSPRPFPTPSFSSSLRSFLTFIISIIL